MNPLPDHKYLRQILIGIFIFVLATSSLLIILVKTGKLAIVGTAWTDTHNSDPVTGTQNSDSRLSLSQLPTSTPTTTPVAYAKLSGAVINSFDGEKMPNLQMKLIGSTSQSQITSADGSYQFTQIVPGEYVLSAQDENYFASSSAIMLKNSDIQTKDLRVSLKNPKPSKLVGSIYEDRNVNFKKDSGEKPLSGILSIYKYVSSQKTEFVTTISVDSSGSFTYSLLGPAKYLISPGAKTFYNPPEYPVFVSKGLGQDVFVNVGYLPASGTNTVSIYVFNDKNSNSLRDSGEENIYYQSVKVTNTSNGEVANYAVPETGMILSNLEFGNYTFIINPENESWQYYYPSTKSIESAAIGPQTEDITVYLGVHKQ